jgi:hypothetical protein
MPSRLVKSHRERRVRKITGIIANNGTATISAGSGFTIVRNGVGDVTVTPSLAGRTLLGVHACAINSTAATSHSAKALAASASSVQFGTYVADATDGAPADVNFSFEITLRDV